MTGFREWLLSEADRGLVLDTTTLRPGIGFDSWRRELWEGVKAGRRFRNDPAAMYRAVSDSEFVWVGVPLAAQVPGFRITQGWPHG